MKTVNRFENRLGIASGTFVLTVCTLVIKVIGFAYKIPLYNAIGASGAGLYQTVFPTFSLMLSLAVSGVPSAMTKLIAGGESAKSVLKSALKIFVPIGIVLSGTLYFGAQFFSAMQGNKSATNLYKIISISVFFVSIMSCLRGYFQGQSNLKPTAISQLIEQFSRAFLGVLFFVFSNGNYYQKTSLAITAITLSELFALIYLFAVYLHSSKNNDKVLSKESKGINIWVLIVTVLPLTAIGLMSPLANFIDSFMAVNLLKAQCGSRAIELYGSYAGSVQAIISLPLAILHAMALGFLPKLASAKTTFKRKIEAKRLLAVTMGLAFAFFFAIILFAPLAVKILFSGLGDGQLLARMLQIASINVISLSMLTASNTILLSMGKQLFSLCSMPFGLIVKTIINLTLLKKPEINIFGLIISDAGCYFVALFLNLLYIIYCNRKQKVGNGNEDNLDRARRGQRSTLIKRI